MRRVPRRLAKSLRTSLATAALLAGLLPCGSAVAADPGPALGSSAPAFRLEDQTGAERSLGSLLGRGKLAVVFFRSADW